MKLINNVKKIISENTQNIKQFIKFCFVGLSNTIIWLALYYLFITINKDWYLLGNTVGFLVSVLNAYFWNNKFVFKNKNNNSVKIIVKSYIAYGTTFLLSTMLLYIMIELLKISALIAPIINLAITTPTNYLINKFWTFK